MPAWKAARPAHGQEEALARARAEHEAALAASRGLPVRPTSGPLDIPASAPVQEEARRERERLARESPLTKIAEARGR